MNSVITKLSEMLQRVSIALNPEDQIRLIVDSVSEVLEVDVCSLYLQTDKQDMALIASHGLKTKQNIRVPKGQGLIGLVFSANHPVNVAVASAHPNYHFVKGTGEERYKSFCGVPLVSYGEVIGGLVVQSASPKQLSEEKEALLVTLAAHLSLIVPGIKQRTEAKNQNIRLKGIKGASGLTLGNAHCINIDYFTQNIEAFESLPPASEEEWERLKSSVLVSLQQEQSRFNSAGDIAGIFDAYLQIIKDPALNQKILEGITQGFDIATSIKQAIILFSELFKAIDDPYLAARSEDFFHLGNKLLSAYYGENERSDEIDSPVILIGNSISVSDLASIASEHLLGIVCGEGSHLSHTSVLANALGIPAVMGVSDIALIQHKSELIVDADNGEVILHPAKSLLTEVKKSIALEKHSKKVLLKNKDLPAETADGYRINLYTNTGLLADISPGLDVGAEGVGLYRTEIPFMACQTFPSEDEQVLIYKEVLKAYSGKSVYVRILDIGGDKQLPYFPILNEENPALGWRGIRFGLDNSQLLMTQVRAILKSSVGEDNLHILLPMVSCLDEIISFKKLLSEAFEQLKSEGLTLTYPKLGVMIEVPGAISQLPFWRSYIDFCSIGSNDLSQYLLSLDRNNPRVSNRYDAVHPAVIHEMSRLISSAKSLSLPACLCGEMATDPVAVVLLVGFGIDTISMSSARLPQIKNIIRSISFAEAQSIGIQALTCVSAKEVRALVENYLHFKGL